MKEQQPKSVVIKGKVKDVCAELAEETAKHKNMTVGKWLKIRKKNKREKEKWTKNI